MSGKQITIGFIRFGDNNKTTIEFPPRPKTFRSFDEALSYSKDLLRTSPRFGKIIILKEIAYVTATVYYDVTNPETGESLFDNPSSEELEKTLVAQLPEEEQQPDVSEDIESLTPNNPYVPTKMVRSTGPMVQLYTLDPQDLFVYNKTTYRLLHTSYPYKSRVFNTETKQEEDISSCVYVIPVTEQTP